MADYGIEVLWGYDYLAVFMAGLFIGIWLTCRCIRFGIKMTQDIQTDYPFENEKQDSNQEKTE